MMWVVRFLNRVMISTIIILIFILFTEGGMGEFKADGHKRTLSSFLALFREWSAIDRGFRVIQNLLLIFIIFSQTSTFRTYPHLHTFIEMTHLVLIVTLIRRIRNGIRFVRGRIALNSVKEDIQQLSSLNSLTLNGGKICFMLVSDIMDFIWYLTDHYSVAHLLKIVSNEAHLSISNDIGNYTTLGSWIFLALARYCQYLNAKRKEDKDRLRVKIGRIMLDACTTVALIVPTLMTPTSRYFISTVTAILAINKY